MLHSNAEPYFFGYSPLTIQSGKYFACFPLKRYTKRVTPRTYLTKLIRKHGSMLGKVCINEDPSMVHYFGREGKKQSMSFSGIIPHKST